MSVVTSRPAWLGISLRALRFAPALAWTALIFLLSAQAELPDGGWLAVPGVDKLIHAAVYAILAALCLGADRGQRPWLWAAAAALYGVTDELHQAFVPGRVASAADWLADAVGSALAALSIRGGRLARGGRRR